jgi:hypothetical protein
VTLDPAGHLYGTTYYGGEGATGPICQNTGCGTVFELMAGKNDRWRERILIHFGPVLRHSKKAAFPAAPVIRDAAGNLYSTATSGGAFGTIFKLTHGTWALTQLHNFIGANNGDGKTPTTGLVFSPSLKKLYGTTEQGGNPGCNDVYYGCGVAYEVTP